MFELSPPSTFGGNWTESILWNCGNGTDGYGPATGLIIDTRGNLYGTAYGGAYGAGIVFELTPPSTSGGNWTESILWSFCSKSNCTDGGEPRAGLIMDKSGNLYGTTSIGAFTPRGTPGLSPGGQCSS